MSKLSRKIQCYGNPVDSGDLYLHPVTLKLTKNESNYKICPSELNKNSKGEYKFDIVNDSTNFNKRSLQTFIALPYLDFNIDMMLDIYKINDIDSLLIFVNKMIDEKKDFETVNRIFNIWINKNFNDIVGNHNIIIKIVKKILKQYKEIEANDLDKRIKKWFDTKDINDFSFNLINELNL